MPPAALSTLRNETGEVSAHFVIKMCLQLSSSQRTMLVFSLGLLPFPSFLSLSIYAHNHQVLQSSNSETKDKPTQRKYITTRLHSKLVLMSAVNLGLGWQEGFRWQLRVFWKEGWVLWEGVWVDCGVIRGMSDRNSKQAAVPAWERACHILPQETDKIVIKKRLFFF